MPFYTLDYRVAGQPHSHRLELQQPQLSEHEAAMHLILLHFGDSENSLVIPAADATAEEIMAQAQLLGLSDIEVAETCA
ncbi:hypothetical protein [Pseudomonas phoenicis]|uniref:hypothetical protein n=1 Tax=unclassified Pseudomonas TaxID=196821 RepID=UPI00399FB8B6